MKHVKQICSLMLHLIRMLLLTGSILLMCAPILFAILYATVLDNYSLITAVSEFAYPWNLIQTPAHMLIFIGLIFFAGIALFFLSRLFYRIIKKLHTP